MRFRKIWRRNWWCLGELCEVPRYLLWRRLRLYCLMYNGSFIFFNKCLYFSYYMAGHLGPAMYFILLSQKETDLNLWTAWVQVLPHLVHSRLQWLREDRNKCIREAMRRKLLLCCTGVEGHVQGHRWKLSPCRRRLSTQWSSHSCRLRKRPHIWALE